MSADLYQHINVTVYESYEWGYTMDGSSQTVTGYVTYRDNKSGWMSRVPSEWSSHPEIEALLLRKISATGEAGNVVKVRLDYENNSSTATYPGREAVNPIKRYHVEPGGSEEHILTNEIFAPLTDAEKQAALALIESSKTSADFATAAETLTSTEGLLLLEKVRGGIQAFRAPSLVWVESFTTDTLDDVELSKIYKTTTSPPGNPPTASDRNYLYLPPSVTPNADGTTWNLEKRWELSLSGGWDPDFYPSSS